MSIKVTLCSLVKGVYGDQAQKFTEVMTRCQRRSKKGILRSGQGYGGQDMQCCSCHATQQDGVLPGRSNRQQSPAGPVNMRHNMRRL